MLKTPYPRDSLDEYLARRAKHAGDIGDKSGVGRIGDLFGITAEDMRCELRRAGWRREASKTCGLLFWRPPNPRAKHL